MRLHKLDLVPSNIDGLVLRIENEYDYTWTKNMRIINDVEKNARRKQNRSYIRLSRNKHMIQSYLQETQDEHIWNVFALSYNESAIFSRA